MIRFWSGATWTAEDGREMFLTTEDFLVVARYNV